tara:strand:+ start:250 stop:1248 length:999 start_codon:yes stop_codon:yes gene_type:complete
LFKDKTILITGGTGSFGTNFINYFIRKKINFKKILIFSRDEFKQFNIENNLPKNLKNKFRFFLGDVRDLDRLEFALRDVDYVIHAAALKHVPKAEYNPYEYIKTNILGTQNIVQASLKTNVKKVISLSTDKASSPINLYGATKLCADKLITSANNIKGKKKIEFSVVRYGNVFGSRGSVIPKFLNINPNSTFPITHQDMTRFNISLEDAIDLVIWTLNNSFGGEVVVPILSSYKIIDVARSINPDIKLKYTGIRVGEKIHEEMISYNESRHTISLNDKYIILPEYNLSKSIKFYKKFKDFKEIKKSFQYTSNQKKFLTVKELQKLIDQFKNK